MTSENNLDDLNIAEDMEITEKDIGESIKKNEAMKQKMFETAKARLMKDHRLEKYFEFCQPAKSREKSIVEKQILMLTNTTTHATYAIHRLNKTEDLMRWPIEMRDHFDYLEKNFERKALLTEFNYAMMELCLNVPIQAMLVREGKKIDLENSNVNNYEDRCFVGAIEIINFLYQKQKIKDSDLRIPIEILRKRAE